MRRRVAHIDIASLLVKLTTAAVTVAGMALSSAAIPLVIPMLALFAASVGIVGLLILSAKNTIQVRKEPVIIVVGGSTTRAAYFFGRPQQPTKSPGPIIEEVDENDEPLNNHPAPSRQLRFG